MKNIKLILFIVVMLCVYNTNSQSPNSNISRGAAVAALSKNKNDTINNTNNLVRNLKSVKATTKDVLGICLIINVVFILAALGYTIMSLITKEENEERIGMLKTFLFLGVAFDLCFGFAFGISLLSRI